MSPPRIDAPSIDEHTRVQNARILDAATALFHSRGYRNTDMEQIGRAVGLARNSLYRYYRNKDHILLACVKRDMSHFIGQMEVLEAQHPDPAERLSAWLDAQIELATSPAHATLELMSEIRQAAPALRREIMIMHGLPNAVLERALRQLVDTGRRDLDLLVAMIAGMVEKASALAIRQGNKAVVQRELRSAVNRVLGD